MGNFVEVLIQVLDETTFCFACDDHAVAIYCVACDTTSDCSVCGCTECGSTEYTTNAWAL